MKILFDKSFYCTTSRLYVNRVYLGVKLKHLQDLSLAKLFHLKRNALNKGRRQVNDFLLLLKTSQRDRLSIKITVDKLNVVIFELKLVILSLSILFKRLLHKLAQWLWSANTVGLRVEHTESCAIDTKPDAGGLTASQESWVNDRTTGNFFNRCLGFFCRNQNAIKTTVSVRKNNLVLVSAIMHESLSQWLVDAFDCWLRATEKRTIYYVLEIYDVNFLQISFLAKPWFKFFLLDLATFKVPTEVHYSKLINFA